MYLGATGDVSAPDGSSAFMDCKKSLSSSFTCDPVFEVDGVEEVNGKTVLKCWQDKWWAAPACRHNISGCVTVISGGPGWGWPAP